MLRAAPRHQDRQAAGGDEIGGTVSGEQAVVLCKRGDLKCVRKVNAKALTRPHI